MGFDEFLDEFKSAANAWVREWSIDFRLPSIPVYVERGIEEERGSPGPFFVTPGITCAGHEGPCIIFPEEFLRFLYERAVSRGKLGELWNYLYWVLAHEFGHYMTVSRPLISLFDLPTGIKRREIAASMRALQLTGKPRFVAKAEFFKITGMSESAYASWWYRRHRESASR